MSSHISCLHNVERASPSPNPPRALQQRSSKTFIILTVSFSIFTVSHNRAMWLKSAEADPYQDLFLYGVVRSRSSHHCHVKNLTMWQIVPIIPFALQDRIGIPHDRGSVFAQHPESCVDTCTQYKAGPRFSLQPSGPPWSLSLARQCHIST